MTETAQIDLPLVAPDASVLSRLPARLNLAHEIGRAREPMDFVLPGLKRATVGALISPGGVGKSFWALGVAAAIGLGARGDISGLSPVRGRVVLFSGEDDGDILCDRLESILAQAASCHAKRTIDYAGLDLRSTLGMRIDLMDPKWYAQIEQIAHGARLVIFDTLTRFHGLDENSAKDMGALIAQLERLARYSGAAVVYLHHTSKVAAINGQHALQQAARGSSVLIDNARWAAYLADMTEREAQLLNVPRCAREQYVRWNISKQNYGPAIEDVWYRRCEGGALACIPLTANTRHVDTAAHAVAESYEHARSETGAAPLDYGQASARNVNNGNW